MHDVIAIALDDDQGAYIDNDTWPAPHWHAYVDWLRLTVQQRYRHARSAVHQYVPNEGAGRLAGLGVGRLVPKRCLRIGEHDLANSISLPRCCRRKRSPVMQRISSRLAAGRRRSLPRPSDPSNTALALNELLRDGTHGIVNFPVQDTIYPDGWEAPWANWSYAWDAALTGDVRLAQRWAPTAQFGDAVRAYGPLLARTHVWRMRRSSGRRACAPRDRLSNADFAAFADSTIRMQRACSASGITCTMVDLKYGKAWQAGGLPFFCRRCHRRSQQVE